MSTEMQSSAVYYYPEDHERIRSAYEALGNTLGSALTMFQTWAWFLHHVEGEQSARGTWKVVVIFSSGEVVAIFPLKWQMLAVSTRIRMDALCVMHNRLGESCVQIGRGCSSDEVLSGLIEALRAHSFRWDVLGFVRQLPESFLYDRGDRSRAQWVRVMDRGVNRWVATVGSYKDYATSLSKSFRRNQKNIRNRLSSGNINVEYLRAETHGPGLDAAMEVFFRLESSGWKAERIKDARIPGFKALIESAASEGWAHVDTLLIDGVEAAATLSFSKPRSKLLVYKVAYNEGLSRFSPGILLIEHLLERCFEDSKVEVVDFLSDAEWLRPFRPQEYGLRSALCFNRTVRGVFWYCVVSLVECLRKLGRRHA